MARSRNLDAQRERLSEATWAVLTERGLPGLTIRAVAERAGCTTGLVMHAFPTKESLLLHARDLLHARTKVRLESAESATAAAFAPTPEAPGGLAAALAATPEGRAASSPDLAAPADVDPRGDVLHATEPAPRPEVAQRVEAAPRALAVQHTEAAPGAEEAPSALAVQHTEAGPGAEEAPSALALPHTEAAPRAEVAPRVPALQRSEARQRAEDAPRVPALQRSEARQRAEAVLRAVMLEAMSLDDASVDVARVWISYLAASLADPVLAARHVDGNRSLIARVTRLLGDCRPEWEEERTHAEALALISLADGANTLAAADPATYTPALQRRMMTEAITRALASPGPLAAAPAGVSSDTGASPDAFQAAGAAVDSESRTAPGTVVAGVRVRAFEEADTDAVAALWAECGLTRPWNDPRKDIARKLDVQRDLFLVAETCDSTQRADAVEADDGARPGDGARRDERRIVGTVMGGYDGHRGWVNYLAVDPGVRGLGLGRVLMDQVEGMLVARGCPKLNLQIREGNEPVQEFYRTLGYTRDAAVSFGKRLIPDA